MLGACGGTTAAGGEARLLSPTPPERSGLVWTRDASGAHHTLWVDLAGEPLSSQPIEGPLWAVDDTLWQWIEETVELPLTDESGEPTGETASLRRAILRELTEELSVAIVDPELSGPMREASHEVTLVGSVGSLVFVEERLSIDAFGAHGHTQATAHVWDLRAAAEAEVLTDRERTHLVAPAAEAAAAELAGEARDMGLEDAAAGDLRLVAVRPVWPSEGELTVQLQMAAEACYACSDQRWSDYTRSAVVEAGRLPERLAPHALPPRWVRAALERAEGQELLGFSEITTAAPARVLEALRR